LIGYAVGASLEDQLDCHASTTRLSKKMAEYPVTPDQHYFVVRGRLWRQTNPTLDPTRRDRLVSELMAARRSVRDAKDDVEKREHARERVNDAKVALGERGPPWWNDGSPDYNRYLARNTPYADWYAILEDEK
jgi:hypothetical protein